MHLRGTVQVIESAFNARNEILLSQSKQFLRLMTRV